MADTPGRTLLHYRLTEKIGEGGMGAVWRAIDTTLDREVAIKLLPEIFSADPDRLARFDREAKLLASLNHPNIAGIYGIHEDGGTRFLAMELIEGEDLAQILARGALPRQETLRVSLQIARALEGAHESGVIHRDLKPANIKLARDGAVKVLDFGLAKAFAPTTSADDARASLSPTLTATGTMAGVILGTAAYMSPEQAKGKAVDRRADIWSLGAVIFEMLSGRRLFSGETISETLAAVMMKEVDWDALPADTPPRLRRLLRRCLQRDPAQRLRDAGDARIAIEETIADPLGDEATPSPQQRRPIWLTIAPWALAAASIVAGIGLALSPGARRAPLPVMRFTMSIPEDQTLITSAVPMMAISPDGARFVFLGRGPTAPLLYQRLIHQQEATPIQGTENADSPFFSPDSQWLGFTQNGKLKKISVLGGPPTTLCDAPRLRGAAWGDDGYIVFAPDRASGLLRIPEAGGEPEVLTTVSSEATTVSAPSHRWPEFVREANAVLFTSTANNSSYTEAEIMGLTLDDMQSRVLLRGGTYPRFVPPGFLVFSRQETLFGVRVDPASLEVLGQPVPVLEGLQYYPFYGSTQLTFSDAGTMVHLGGSAQGNEATLVWVDREGKEEPASANVRDYGDASLSPDGRLLAVGVKENNSEDVWILEFERDTLTRLTFDPLTDQSPVWSTDGEWIVFSSLRDETALNLYRKRANGTGEVERLTMSESLQVPNTWSPDGKTVVFVELGDDTGTDIMLLHLDSEPETEAFLKTPFFEFDPVLSPDGRWLAYLSTESGSREVYVRPARQAGGQVKISTHGGDQPGWSPDGREIWYLTLSEDGRRTMLAVDIRVEGDAIRPAVPRPLFEFPDSYDPDWVGSPTGDRILVRKTTAAEPGGGRLPVVVVNWLEELAAKIPEPR